MSHSAQPSTGSSALMAQSRPVQLREAEAQLGLELTWVRPKVCVISKPYSLSLPWWRIGLMPFSGAFLKALYYGGGADCSNNISDLIQ